MRRGEGEERHTCTESELLDEWRCVDVRDHAALHKVPWCRSRLTADGGMF